MQSPLSAQQVPPMPNTAPYGSWRSPISAEMAAIPATPFPGLVVDARDVFWLESRPTEAGRCTIVRRASDGTLTECTPPQFYVRTTAHEYGGGAFTVSRGTIYFVNYRDQRLYRQALGGVPQVLTPRPCRADPAPGRRRGALGHTPHVGARARLERRTPSPQRSAIPAPPPPHHDGYAPVLEELAHAPLAVMDGARVPREEKARAPGYRARPRPDHHVVERVRSIAAGLARHVGGETSTNCRTWQRITRTAGSRITRTCCRSG